MPWTAILTTGAKAFAGGGAKAALKAGAKQAVRGAGRKMAGKMLGRGKKGKGPQQQDPSSGEVGGEDTGGALVKGGSSAIIPTGVKSSALAISQTSAGGGGGQDLEGTVLRIKTSVIKVENLLAGSAALQEKQREDQRKAREAAEASAREGQLEKPKDKKQKFRIPQPKVVKSFWQKIMSFIMNTVLGFITVRLLPFMDKMAPVIKLLVGIGEWALKISGWIFNALVTAVDWVYKLVEGARKWVGDTFGEQAVVWFDKLSGALNTLINGFIVWKLVGERIFQAAVGAIKTAWKLAANIVKQTGRLLNWASGGRLGKLATKLSVGARRLIGPGARKFLKAPGKVIGGAVRNVGGKILQGGKGLLAKGAGKVGGFAAKIFGKMAGVIAPAFKAAKPFASKFFSRVPILGPFIVGIISLLSGEGAGKAIFKTLGTALGEFLGGALAGALAVGTAGLGAFVAPALVILGGTLGAFLGDFLYDLFAGSGVGNATKKLGKIVKGIFDKILDVKDWIVGGFGRFFTAFMEKHSFQLPGLGLLKRTPGLPKWVKEWDGRIPNMLQLMNPLAMFPLLKKSFFPPSGESTEKTPSLKTGDGGSKDAEIGAVSTSASYEDETVVLPPRLVKEGDGDKTSEKALFITSGVLYSAGGGAQDPYEKLYIGGLG